MEGDYGEYEQIGLFASYFSFVEHEEGFLIKDVYTGNRGLVDGERFVSKIEHALLHTLDNQKESSSLLVSVDAFIYMMDQVNCSELPVRDLMPATLEYLHSEKAKITYFGDCESSTFAVEEAIFSLKDQAILIYQERLGIMEDKELRSETDQEASKFLEYSRNAMKEMGYKTTDEVYDNGLWKEHQDNVKEKLKRDLGIDYVGRIYAFGFNHDDVRAALVRLEEIEEKQLD